MGGDNEVEGTVEICYDHIWGLISDAGWNDNDAEIVCTQLGYQIESKMVIIIIIIIISRTLVNKLIFTAIVFAILI